MDYKEQQEQEIEALRAIYQEEEIEVESEKYPNISVRVYLNSNEDENDGEQNFSISLLIELPENYPDVVPKITVEGLDEYFNEERINAVNSKLEEEAKNNVGMVMVFSIVSAMQEEIGTLLQELKQLADQKAAAEKEKKEAVERRKFEGTLVTPESFKAWKEKFDKERKALQEKQEKMSHHSDGRASSSRGSGNSRNSNGKSGGSLHLHQSHPFSIHMPAQLQVKSKFDAEWRRFSFPTQPTPPTYEGFRRLVEKLHHLDSVPFTLCYTSSQGDLLPITNDENLRKSFESARPTLRLLIQRKGESWEEKYGYGTDSDRKRKGISALIAVQKPPKRNYSISNPEDFRQVSAIIDVDIVPEAHRRVRLCKHGQGDRPLGFYIRDGATVRLTERGVQKVQGIFISRLVEGGLAESTGLLAVNDEVLEVNGIDVNGKTLDQVTDMMVANAQNLIITVKPANQRNTLQRHTSNRSQQPAPEEESDSEDEIIDHSRR